MHERVAVIPDGVDASAHILGDGPAATDTSHGIDQIVRPDPCVRVVRVPAVYAALAAILSSTRTTVRLDSVMTSGSRTSVATAALLKT
jgi:hypothetical protein